VRSISPNTIIFSDIGPHIRWVGNENGIAGKTNWNLLDTAGFTPGAGAPPVDTLNQGNENGKNWIPAECDVSIRPGWFYHKEEDNKVKTPEQLFDLYLKSVGRGANLLLNVPPDRRGLINENDSAALMGFRKLREDNFKNNLVKYRKPYGLEFGKPRLINCVVLKENLKQGQSCKEFRLILMNEKHEVIKEIKGTTIGRKRIITFPSTTVTTIGFRIEESIAPFFSCAIEAYLINEKLIEK
jgi:alpha-L-fucosidase